MSQIRWNKQNVKKFWDCKFSNIRSSTASFSYNFGTGILRHAGNYIDFDSINSALDFGCGPGHMVEYLMKLVKGPVYAGDYSEEALSAVSQKFTDCPDFGKTVLIKDMADFFGENGIGLITMIEVIEHLDDKKLADTLDLIYRILKPEGFVIITTPNKEDLDANKTVCPECGCIFHPRQHLKSYSAKILSDVLAKAGFYKCSIEETNLKFFSSGLSSVLYRIFSKMSCIKGRFNIFPHLIYIGRKSKSKT